MELVLSPGGSDTGSDNGPFRNEDVREWSRVDRITGMLERARVETDRWRANTEDAKQSYGKMTDSRERNTADGSLVQKARRQVEIFQSQGVGGRNFQVVRASQWSSSRATDCAIDIPINKFHNTHTEDTMNGDTLTPRLSFWRPSLADTASDLDHLSLICRKLHNEAMTTAMNNFWPIRSITRSPSPLSIDCMDEESQSIREIDDILSSSSIADRRSNSTEDVSSLLNANDEHFARDCKMRRSLQIPNNSENSEKTGDDRLRRRAELIAERAKKFEEGEKNEVKKSFISTKTFTPIANNDFVRNDPKHPSKFNQVAKISIQDNGQGSSKKLHVSSPILQRKPVETRKANNKTVVHLRNAASPENENSEPTRCINVMAIKLEKKNLENQENGHYTKLMDSSSNFKDDSAISTTLVNGTKPIKKVEFCKTEIHFAADSGKVNIVETDGKPPPTNKFRRRRRNNSLGATNNINTQKSNMPLVHFGDTSYEKYIFGGGKLPQDMKTDNFITENGVSHKALDTEIRKDRWDNQDKIRENGILTSSRELCPVNNSHVDLISDKNSDQNNKYRGTHTTTVNFLSDESGAVVPKVSEGSRRIQLQFAASSRNLSPIQSDDDETSVVSRTTKITVHLPPVISNHHHNDHPSRALQIINPFTNLKSVRLVMNIGQTTSQSTTNDSFGHFFSRFTDNPDEFWSLRLRDCLQDDGPILDESRMIMDKPQETFTTANNMGSLKERQPNKNPIISKELDHNQVHLKTVTTHKPILARIENDQHVSNSLKSRLKTQNTSEDESPHEKSKDIARVSNETKDNCDNSNGVDETNLDDIETPLYENIFDAVTDGVPVYENFQVVKTIPLIEEIKIDEEKKKVPVEKLSKKLPLRESMEKSSKPRTKNSRSITPMSVSSKNSSDNTDTRRSNRISTRTSNSRENSIKRHKDARNAKEDKDKSLKTTKNISIVHERKGTPTNLITAEKNNGSLKTKKPVEVVYQTAVYNMKNEKLSKPKAKETKGPRLINELICGTKFIKKPLDSKKTNKTAIVSQNTSKRKETPTTMNR